MKALVFGATGMVGQGVVRECIKDASITKIITVGRTPGENKDPKIQEIIAPNLFDLNANNATLSNLDVCFFCLGTTSAGKSEAEYRRITHDLTIAIGMRLAPKNPEMTFVYISGEGADETGKSAAMWARVRGETENDLRALPFKAVYIVRPGMIQPLDGIQSKTASYRIIYGLMKPVMPLLRKLFPNSITSTRELGRALINVAKNGSEKAIITSKDFRSLQNSVG